MHITLGLDLDACQGPAPDDHLARPVVGPMGMLSLLETWLGLAMPEVGHARRVAVYLGALRQVDGPQRFFHRSLAADDMGTAAHLLAWRDAWAMGCATTVSWAHQVDDACPLRLRDMAAVERAAGFNLPAGEAERLAAVAAVLAVMGAQGASDSVPVDTVALVDPLDDWPRAWREVLALLPGVTPAEPSPQGHGALLTLQRRALDAVAAGRTGSSVASADNGSDGSDGSVLVISTPTATTAAHWLGALQAAQPADRLVVAEDHGDLLDTTLDATGGARCGFEPGSPLRPPLQALGLALDLCWSPLDVGRAMDFLTHPVGPFSRSARRQLAESLSKEPGVGGPQWQMTTQALLERLPHEEARQRLRQDIAFWLEGERHARAEGAPLGALRERVTALAEALRRRMNGGQGTALSDDAAVDPTGNPAAVLGPAYSQCQAVLEGLNELERQGMGRVLPRTLAQLLARATPGGATSPDARPQAGCMRSARLAAACVHPADEVIWWMPAAPALPGPPPWSAAEVQALQRLGVELPQPTKELAALSRRWLRPLLAARRRFVLVLPPPGTEVHPTRQLLQQLVPALEAAAHSTSPRDWHTLPGPHALPARPAMPVLASAVVPQPIPEVPEVLHLPGPVALRAGRAHSYTTLNDLFNAPALYALKHLAALRPAAHLAAEEDNRLLGVLAHRVFEQCFAQPDALAWRDEQARTWLASVWGPLLQAEGAVLLMQGAGVSQQRLRRVCERALCGLLGHLRDAGATRVETEVKLQGTFADTSLTGTVDLLVHLRQGGCVALDMKWSGLKRYRKLLEEGGHLQLALYWGLIAEQPDRTPPVALGYYILDSAALLVTHADIFPCASVHHPPDGAGTASLLHQARRTWDWRTGQLRDGLLAVVPTDADESHAGPPGTLPVKGPQRFDADHTVLLGGWERGWEGGWA